MPLPYPCEWKDLYTPSVEDLCKCLSKGLKSNFEDVTVEEVDCPDLSQKPWSLAAPGICGSPTLLDVGAVPYLVPTPQKDKVYKFDDLAEEVGNKNALFIGAGHCGFQLFGGNGEMMANLRVGSSENLKTYVAKVTEDNKVDLNTYPIKDFGLLGNFLSCEGKQGKVLRVHAKKRTSKDDFISSIRHALVKTYPKDMIGLGGVFLIKTGKAHLHVMPPGNEKPLLSDQDVQDWLTFHEMDAPLTCLSVFYNIDPGLDLRICHSHCFSHHGAGGHYHYDTTPDIVEYEGYFVVADRLLRVDRPKVTHNIGRD